MWHIPCVAWLRGRAELSPGPPHSGTQARPHTSHDQNCTGRLIRGKGLTFRIVNIHNSLEECCSCSLSCPSNFKIGLIKNWLKLREVWIIVISVHLKEFTNTGYWTWGKFYKGAIKYSCFKFRGTMSKSFTHDDIKFTQALVTDALIITPQTHLVITLLTEWRHRIYCQILPFEF